MSRHVPWIEDRSGALRQRGTLVLLLLTLALSCTQPRMPRDAKKPRVQVVLLATAGRVGEPVLASKVASAWRAEEARCARPQCELLKVAIGAEPELLAPLGYDAVLSTAPGPRAVATNVDGGVGRLTMTRASTSLEVLGMFTGQEGDDATERAMQLIASKAYLRSVNGTVVVSDDCTTDLERIIGRHGYEWWLLSAAIGRACDGSPKATHVRSTAVAGAVEVRTGYTRLVLDFDKNTHSLLSATTTFESWK